MARRSGAPAGDRAPTQSAAAERTEEAVFAAAVAGDLDAWQELVRRLDAWLVGYLRGRAFAYRGRALGPEDLAQQVWLVAWIRRAAFTDRGPGSLKAWLRRIALNKVHDAARGGSATKRDTSREAGSSSRVVGPGRSPSSVAGGSEDAAWLRWAFQSLTNRQRWAIRLVQTQGLAYAEAGARLNPPLGAEAMRKLFTRSVDALTALRLAFDLLEPRSRRVLSAVELAFFEAGGSEVRARLTLVDRLRMAARALNVTPEAARLLWDQARAALLRLVAELTRLAAARAQTVLPVLRKAWIEGLQAPTVARRLALGLPEVEAILARAAPVRARLGRRGEAGDAAARPR